MKKLKRGDYIVVEKCKIMKKAGCIVYLEEDYHDGEFSTIIIKGVKPISAYNKTCRKGGFCYILPRDSIRYLTDKEKILALKWILLGKKHKQEEE